MPVPVADITPFPDPKPRNSLQVPTTFAPASAPLPLPLPPTSKKLPFDLLDETVTAPPSTAFSEPAANIKAIQRQQAAVAELRTQLTAKIATPETIASACFDLLYELVMFQQVSSQR